MEAHGAAEIVLGDGVVFSIGVQLAGYAGIFIGIGSMIGEYSSMRDAEHTGKEGRTLLDSGYAARPVFMRSQGWSGRGVAVASGVAIRDGATVGANVAESKDVAAGAMVAGVPAVPIQRDSSSAVEMQP
jgi:acetyltransferase-like isoleucine patch superfamily enzyme